MDEYKPVKNKEDHIERHKLLHRMFDELVADYISCGDLLGEDTHLPSQTTVSKLMEWSYQQTISPDEKSFPNGYSDESKTDTR